VVRNLLQMGSQHFSEPVDGVTPPPTGFFLSLPFNIHRLRYLAG